jgi:trimethylamine--corrinoid protein Co-methyltransferase
MTVNNRAFRPVLTFLSNTDKKDIFKTALNILIEIGMEIQHDEALTLLHEAGCSIEADKVVKIPATLVAEAIENAPVNISIFDREGHPAMELGGQRAYFGTGSDLLYTLDPENEERRLSQLDDVGRAARVCDALANIDFIMSCAHPSDVSPQRAYLISFKIMTENSTKPIVCTAENRDDLAEMWEIANILREGQDRLRSLPYFIHYAEPISPLKHPFASLDKLLFCLAESLCGLVIHQLKRKSAPFLLGMGPAVLDMTTGECSYNAPEYYLAYVAMIEMSHYLDLPSWGYAGTTDSQIPDGQATLEAGFITFLSAFGGANLNHDVGYMNFGRTGSLVLIVITDEIIDQVRRMINGIPVNDEMLAMDVIRNVGQGGNFLTHDHTFQHYRSTQWRPKLFNRRGYDEWAEKGKLSLLERARGRLFEILEIHRPMEISAKKMREIDDFMRLMGE